MPILLVILAPLAYFSQQTASPVFAGWYNTAWKYRKKITIQASKVNTNLSNWPIYFTRPNDPDLAARAQSDGDDILFTKDDGITKIDHELVYFNNTTGELRVWIEVPSISSTTDTVLYMYYGNSSASSQENVSGTWNSTNWAGVWHLEESSGTAYDTTTNNNDGTMYNITSVTGKIGNAFDFNGSSSKVIIPQSSTINLTTNDDYTIIYWVYFDTATTNLRSTVMKYWFGRSYGHLFRVT